MINKRLIIIFIVLVLVLSSLTLFCGLEAIFQPTAPKVKPGAPTTIKLDEDSSSYYLDLYDIYDESDAPLNFTIWDGSSWGSSFQNNNFTATILSNDTVEFILKPNMHGTDKIILNATNSYGLSTHHNLTVTIMPVNDPPVIEMVGNVQVTDTDFVNLFVYQNDWFNETIIASDIDGDTFVFLDNTTLFDINYLSGNISFQPNNDDVGDIYVNLTVSDINGTNCEDWIIIKFTILNVNDPPTAIINNPPNGTTFYDSYIIFKGEGTDPDLPHGDILFYEWSSNIDGVLGNDPEMEAFYLSKGPHQITLNVSDSGGLYDEDTIIIIVEGYPYKYHEIGLSLQNDTTIIKQNDTGTCELTVSNYGRSEDNVIFETKKYFGFEGEVELEVGNVTIAPYDFKVVNVTISVPAETEIGFYPIDFYARSSDEDYYKYYYKNEAIATVKLIVISNNSEDETKQAEKPTWNLKDKWKYSMIMDDSSMGMNGTLTFEVTEDTTINVNDINYNVYVMDFDSDIKISDYYEYYDKTEINMSGTYYYQKSDLAFVKNVMKAKMSMKMLDEEMTYETEMKTTFDPPVSEYDFPIKPGESWTIKSTVTVKSETKMNDGYDDSYSDIEINEETKSFICLGTKLVTTPAGTFEAYLIMVYDKDSEEKYNGLYNGKDYGGKRSSFFESENPDEVHIDYYSPEINYSLKQVTYEQTYDYGYGYDNWTEIYNWDENGVIELISYSLIHTDKDSESNDSTNDDIDEDGLPDDWEDKYNLEDAYADQDLDGFTNLDEYLNGTDPTNSEDTPANPIDEDEDSLPDAWERYYGLDPTDPTDANDDFDNDGFSNRREYGAHTSPTDPDDHPRIKDDVSDSGGAFGLGKIGGVDLVYIYLVVVIVIIIILALLSILMRRRKSKRAAYQSEVGQRVQKIQMPATSSVPSTSQSEEAQAQRPPYDRQSDQQFSAYNHNRESTSSPEPITPPSRPIPPPPLPTPEQDQYSSPHLGYPPRAPPPYHSTQRRYLYEHQQYSSDQQQQHPSQQRQYRE